jgi:hypothetical protein
LTELAGSHEDAGVWAGGKDRAGRGSPVLPPDVAPSPSVPCGQWLRESQREWGRLQKCEAVLT